MDIIIKTAKILLFILYIIPKSKSSYIKVRLKYNSKLYFGKI